MLVSKTVTVGPSSAVELLAGEDLEQPYMLWLFVTGGAIYVGSESVDSSAFSIGAMGPAYLRNESVWALSTSGTVTVKLLAVSAP